MTKAVASGALILVGASALWFLGLLVEVVLQPLAALLLLSPIAAGALAAYLAPRRKLTAALWMGLIAALLGVLLNGGIQLIGRQVDFPGVGGAAIVFSATALFGTFGALLGGAIGIWAARSKDQRLSGPPGA